MHMFEERGDLSVIHNISISFTFATTCFVISAFLNQIQQKETIIIDKISLIPDSFSSVLGFVSFAIGLYLIGIGIAGRFPLKGSVRWFSMFFLIRILTAIILSHIFTYDDERGFHFAAISLSWGSEFLLPNRAYYGLVVLLYSLFGPNILIPKSINAFLGSLLPFVGFLIATELYGERKYAWRVFWIIGLMPPFVIFSAVNLKETLTSFVLFWIFLGLIISRKKFVMGLILSLIGTGVLYWVRGGLVTTIGTLGLSFGYLWPNFVYFREIKRTLIQILALVNIFILILMLLDPIGSYVDEKRDYSLIFKESKALVVRFLDIDNLFSLKNLIILFVRGLYSPSPLGWLFSKSVDKLIEGFGMVLWYVLFPLSIIGVCRLWYKSEIVALATMSFGILAIATMGVLVGSSEPFRHRVMALPLFVVLASGAMSREVIERYKWVLWLWALSVLGFTGLWVCLKVMG